MIHRSILDSISYFSSPVSWYYFRSPSGRNYYFFGDKHFQNNSSDGYDIIFLLKNIFEIAYQSQIYLDFYIEFPFRDPNQFLSSLEKLAFDLDQNSLTESIVKRLDHQYHQLDDISKLYVRFYQCFFINKNQPFHIKGDQCQYSPFVRFHHSDIRQIINSGFGCIHTYIVSEIDLIIKMVNDYVDHYLHHIKNNNKNVIITKINLITPLIYHLSDPNWNRHIFDLQLYSENFLEDINSVLNNLDSLSNLDLSSLKKTINKLVIITPGKVQHQLKNQLSQLEDHFYLLIEKFLNDSYLQIDISRIYSQWLSIVNNIYKIFEKIDQPRINRYDISKRITSEILNLDLRYDRSSLLSIDALIMDGYVLGKMFQPIRENVYSSEVITFTGIGHTHNYYKFFNDYLQYLLIKS